MHSKLGKPQHHYSLASHGELETFQEEHNSEAGTLVSPGMEAQSLYPCTTNIIEIRARAASVSYVSIFPYQYLVSSPIISNFCLLACTDHLCLLNLLLC